jgi:hypothetical protein
MAPITSCEEKTEGNRSFSSTWTMMKKTGGREGEGVPSSLPDQAFHEKKNVSSSSRRPQLVRIVEQALPHYSVTHQGPSRSIFCVPASFRHGAVTIVLDVRVEGLAVYAFGPLRVSQQDQRVKDFIQRVNPSILIGNLEVTRKGHVRFRHAMSICAQQDPPTPACIFHMIHVAVTSLDRLFAALLRAVQERPEEANASGEPRSSLPDGSTTMEGGGEPSSMRTSDPCSSAHWQNREQ